MAFFGFGVASLSLSCASSIKVLLLAVLHVSYTRDVSLKNKAPSGLVAFPFSRGCDLKPIASPVGDSSTGVSLPDGGLDAMGVVWVVELLNV